MYCLRFRLIALVMIAAVFSGCSTKMARIERALKDYEAALRLEVTPLEESPADRVPITLQVTLKNVKPDTIIDACLGYSRAYSLKADPTVAGRRPLDVDFRIVDHPYCERRFALGSGDELKWVEHVRLNIGPGAARLNAWVSIVYPSNCARISGCYETRIEAPETKVTIRGRRPPDTD